MPKYSFKSILFFPYKLLGCETDKFFRNSSKLSQNRIVDRPEYGTMDITSLRLNREIHPKHSDLIKAHPDWLEIEGESNH